MKLNKKITLLAVLALSAFSTGIATTQAAATNEVTDGTKANINLTTDPTDPGNPGDTGSIILKSAPTIEFGTQVLTGATKTYDATSDPTDPIKVINPGFDSGWTVTVAASEFTSETKTLTGAQLVLDAGTVANADTVDTDTTGVTSTGLTLNDKDATIFDAMAGKGIGTFTSTYAKTQAHLTVPSTATAEAYSATLTWTIKDAPK